MKKLGKDGLSEDLQRDAEASVQELSNSYTVQIDDYTNYYKFVLIL